VVVSLFVNPAQFDERTDLDGYPRQEEHDRRLAAQAGADLLFAPSVEEVYPQGFSTFVEVVGLTDRLEGAVRGSEHFRGVSTVVAKLLNMVLPDVAYFGQKDAQQVAVIRRMVEDLNVPVRIEMCPTVREPDGLAMSSRNARLTPQERKRALALYRALLAATALAGEGVDDAQELIERAHSEMGLLGVQPEYVALVDPNRFEPVERLNTTALLAIAARIGDTRIIDNIILKPIGTRRSSPVSSADDAHPADRSSTTSTDSPTAEDSSPNHDRIRSPSIALTTT
jgi:pantoate--beta-alanine ligase